MEGHPPHLWMRICSALGVTAPFPPVGWVEDHRWELLVALIPKGLQAHWKGEAKKYPTFARKFHLELANRLAALLQRRQLLKGSSESD